MKKYLPIILSIIEYIMNNIKNKHYGVDSLDITGPKAVGRALNKIINNTDNEYWINQDIISVNDNIINFVIIIYYDIAMIKRM